MCVAAAAETMIEALNLYAKETGDDEAFDKLPISSWNGGNLTSIRANLFRFTGTNSSGSADTFQRFGIGKIVPLEQFQPGDFVNFSRTNNSGHAVIFLSFIDRAGADLGSYSAAVAGFRYFSAQAPGKPDAGFAYRWAYFDGMCPAVRDPVRLRDCTMVRGTVVGGYLDSPPNWPGKAKITAQVMDSERKIFAVSQFGLAEPQGLSADQQAVMESVLQDLDSRDLPPGDVNFDGVTTD